MLGGSVNARARRSAVLATPFAAIIVALSGCAATTGSTTATSSSNTAPTAPRAPAFHSGPVARRAGSRPSPGRTESLVALGRRTRTSGCQVRGQLPDPACTPGGVFPNATAADICRSGYARSVRNVLPSTKDAVYASYGIRSHITGQYELDHLVPLEVGGNNTRANLWPQIAPGYGEKDSVENELHAAVCSGRMSLKTAQAEIARDWRHAGVAVPTPATAAPSRSAPPPPPAATYPTAADRDFCATHPCIASFSTGRGTIVRCADGQYSRSGGLPGVCSRHGGPR